MALATSTPELNISLEPHLIQTLTPLLPLLPSGLSDRLQRYISTPSAPTIPYSLLQSISQWSRTTAGSISLNSQTPPLDPASLTMIALLAGSVTSPERNFGDYVPPTPPEVLAAAQVNDRKAITALLNALLSIIGSGVATWWASEKMGRSNEVRVLFALFVALVVAIAEAGLFLIWQHRHQTHTKPRAPNLSKKRDQERDVKSLQDSNPPPIIQFSNTGGLRHRR